MNTDDRFLRIEEKIDLIIEKISSIKLDCVSHTEKIKVLWKSHEENNKEIIIWKFITGLVTTIGIILGYTKF